MNRFLIALLFCTSVYAQPLIKICTGEYALCAASATTPTKRTIQVDGKTFKEGVAVCPVLSGDAVANMNLMNNSCKAPSGKVWSLFGIPPQTSYPQAPTWDVQPAVFRTFTIGETAETGMSNMSGAGWIVRTQEDRGIHYQNFCLQLLKTPQCVGWHWFRYQDNDPNDTKADDSNKDSNKGIVNIGYETYKPLAEKMKSINTRVYDLINYFDKKK